MTASRGLGRVSRLPASLPAETASHGRWNQRICCGLRVHSVMTVRREDHGEDAGLIEGFEDCGGIADLGYEPNELPDCSTPRLKKTADLEDCQPSLPADALATVQILPYLPGLACRSSSGRQPISLNRILPPIVRTKGVAS